VSRVEEIDVAVRFYAATAVAVGMSLLLRSKPSRAVVFVSSIKIVESGASHYPPNGGRKVCLGETEGRWSQTGALKALFGIALQKPDTGLMDSARITASVRVLTSSSKRYV
jgi:hypothetical protein